MLKQKSISNFAPKYLQCVRRILDYSSGSSTNMAKVCLHMNISDFAAKTALFAVQVRWNDLWLYISEVFHSVIDIFCKRDKKPNVVLRITLFFWKNVFNEAFTQYKKLFPLWEQYSVTWTPLIQKTGLFSSSRKQIFEILSISSTNMKEKWFWSNRRFFLRKRRLFRSAVFFIIFQLNRARSVAVLPKLSLGATKKIFAAPST